MCKSSPPHRREEIQGALCSPWVPLAGRSMPSPRLARVDMDTRAPTLPMSWLDQKLVIYIRWLHHDDSGIRNRYFRVCWISVFPLPDITVASSGAAHAENPHATTNASTERWLINSIIFPNEEWTTTASDTQLNSVVAQLRVGDLLSLQHWQDWSCCRESQTSPLLKPSRIVSRRSQPIMPTWTEQSVDFSTSLILALMMLATILRWHMSRRTLLDKPISLRQTLPSYLLLHGSVQSAHSRI